MEKITSLRIVAGFNGAVKVRAVLEGGEAVVIESDIAEKMLMEYLSTAGFRLELKPRQEYRRVVPCEATII